jgi:16S rRNA C1402 (ribose-2'-O) methylase RsmI
VGVVGGALASEGLLAVTSVVVTPSARETFTPRELTDAYEQFIERGPQYVDAETGLSASAYRFGERVLLVYEESETGVVVLTHPRS